MADFDTTPQEILSALAAIPGPNIPYEGRLMDLTYTMNEMGIWENQIDHTQVIQCWKLIEWLKANPSSRTPHNWVM